MRVRTTGIRFFTLIMLLATVACSLSFDVNAQQQRRRRKVRYPRVSRPVYPAPPASSGEVRDAELVGTASDTTTPATGANSSTGNSRQTSATPPSEAESLRRTVETLSSQINSLTKKINDLEGQQHTAADLERLTRAEQRAENLRTQLRDVEQKQGDLRAQIEQIDYQLQPDVLERSTATIGTVNPEAMRADIRARLEKDKVRLAAQLERLDASHARLEAALTTADTYVDRLRASIEADDKQKVPAANASQSENENQQQPLVAAPSIERRTPAEP